MDFFKQLEQFLAGAELQLMISKKGSDITVMVLPKTNAKDEALKQITPIVLTGTAIELDADFFNHVSKPLERAAGIISNVEQFEKNLELAAAENKAAKAKEEQAKKEAEDKKRAALIRKMKVEKLSEMAELLIKQKDLKQAIGAYKEAKKHTDKPDLIDKKIGELVAQLSVGQLFGAAEDYAKVETNFEAAIEKEIEKELSAKDKKGSKPIAKTANSTNKTEAAEEDSEDDEEEEETKEEVE